MFGGLSVMRCGKRAKVIGAVLMTTTAMLGIVATPAAAQTASAQRNFDIPAQSLPQALMIFGRQAGLQVTAVGDVTAGKSSSPVKGDLAPAQALSQLLAGTGLTFRFVGNNGVQIEPAPQTADGSIKLGPVRVEGEGGPYSGLAPSITSDPAATEGTRSYTTESMATATKLPLTIRETPQSVTVVTRQAIEDQGALALKDVIQNVPGVFYWTSGPQRQRFYARGLSVDNLLFDGLPVTLSSSQLSQDLVDPNIAIYDRVEIVRGAAGLTIGSGNPAAAINLVRKRPTLEPQFSIAANAGNWNRYGVEVDLSGPLDKNGTLRARVVGTYNDEDSFRDREHSKRNMIYGIVEKDFGSRTTLSISAMRQEDDLDGNGFTGMPVAADGSHFDLPRSTSYASDWEYWNKDSTSLFASLEHRFDSGWKVNLSAYKVWAKLNMLGHYIRSNVTSGTYDLLNALNEHEENQSSYGLYASGPFKLFGREHELVLGGGHRRAQFDGNTNQGGLMASNIDLYEFDSSAIAKPSLTILPWLDSDIKEFNAYATTRLNLADGLKLIVGGRLDWYNYTDAQPRWNLSNHYEVHRHLTKYAGLIYDLDSHHSAYVSYTDIFKPQNYYDVDHKLLSPIIGKNYEIGIKGAYFDNSLNVSLALFRMDQENRAARISDQTQCSTYPTATCYEAAGLVRAEGIDFEIDGAITPDWQITAGYSHTLAKYRADADVTKIGTLFDTDVPRHLVKVLTNYRLPGNLDTVRIGGSFYWQSTIYNNGTTSGIVYHEEQKAYALVGLNASWQATPNLDIRVNVNNLFDKKYYRSLTGQSGLAYPTSVYGDPRNAMMTARYRF